MRTTLFTALLFMAAVASSQPAFAQVESTEYVIKKGDTLWGLSDRFLKDPYYWPNLWANNDPSITNPHLIFPGQKVKIYPDRIELQPAPSAAQAEKPEAAAPPKAAEVMPEKAFLVRGGTGFLLEKEITPSGYIIATYQNRQMVGEDDVVYTDIGTLQGGKVGNRFSIFNKMAAVSHPLTNVIMGYKVIPLGALQLSEVEEKASKAIISKSFMEIGPGAYLMPYRDRRREVSLKASGKELSGYIIDTQTGNRAISAGDVAFLDLGSSKGVEVGNMLYVVRELVPDQQYVHGTVKRLPDEVIGALVVVETGEKTSTALIVKSIDTVYIGDRVDLKKSK
ncbi:MAG: LysM peptidoglycan-binding domain-containing protein [Geobacter sp.]|nr:MAG: LysM peptidoglycan-binding domain-containing protein [Geobacter sp.]